MRTVGQRVARMASAACALSLVATGLAVPAPNTKPIVEARAIRLAGSLAPTGWSATVATGIPTEMVGFDWRGGSAGAVEVRARRHDGWGPWSRLEGNADEAPDRSSREYHGRTAAGPIWIGRSAKEIQVRVVEGALPGLRLHAIRSEERRGGWAPAPAVADPAQPGIVPRRQWGADESWRTCTPDQARRVDWAIVHHTANSNAYSPADVPALLRGIYRFHTAANGWCDIGYNFLVDRFGRVWEGRAGGIERATVGAHASGFNTGSTGVALIGDFQTSAVPSAAYTGLRRVLAWKLAEGVDANRTITVTAGASTGGRFSEGSEVPVRTISGHRDVLFTDCPGDLAHELLARLRTDVQTDVMNSVRYPARGWQPLPGAPPLLSLDAHGSLHPSGSQAAVAPSAHWPGQMVARGAVRDGPGGYVVDRAGLLHPFGGARPVVSALSLPGLDLARGVARGPVPGSGWVLDAFGGLHPYGGALPVLKSPVWPGVDMARGLATNRSGTGGYVLDRSGGVHRFGIAPPVVTTAAWPGADVARAIALRPDGRSGYVLDRSGGVHPFGGAPAVRGAPAWAGDFARGMALTPSGNGGWVLDADGGISAFGDAPPVAPSLTWTGTGLSRALI